ncbi:siderophore ABC transporter substrate-binding protein [Gracilibacillus sp. S3-1-1]|uniref:Siderophore ABC transporter substrate-binding protein n=1 Tax=Gracilibacillus pellucidus TaxID=3095368 RepID=A0ACC6M186_9BACI|nr:siderophore ABC transporter substrate-binding protein [Gracilibacillus sp. S3-1-1]MDX8044704.1 siderophore ABC transporter substrate-binding protein [Gracilibacillus sp. S3-1-1]
MKNFIFFLSFIAMLAFITACGADNESGAETTEDQNQSEESASADTDSSDAEDTEIVVNHELGETTVPVNPEKVVVFDYGVLETLKELDIDVAGVPQSNLPPHLEQYESDEYTNVGGLKEPDFEALAILDPDLIIISGRQGEMYDELSELAPTIFMGVDTADYMTSFESNVEILGQIFNKEDEVQAKIAEVEDVVNDVEETTKETDGKALIVLTNDGSVSAYGAGSRFGWIHDELGLPQADENIEVATHGQNVSFEYIAEKNPDYLFVIDRNAIVGGEDSAQKTLDNDLVNGTNAAKNDKVIYLDPNFWYISGGGTESVREMVTEVRDGIQE